ncbi:MAG: nucleotidyltransferase family protein [Candidatus Bipolaricaulia bacterium]
MIADRRTTTPDRDRRQLWYRAYGAAQSCARHLHIAYGIKQVYLIGSVADREGVDVHAGSDIDLVVAGLRPSCYFRALADLWRELPDGLELDLIPLEYAHPMLRERALRDGIPLLP